MQMNNFTAKSWFSYIVEDMDLNTADLIVTSPPYYNARKYGDGWDNFKTPQEWEDFCFEMLVTLPYVLKDTGVVWWNTGPGYENNRQLTSIYRLIARVEDAGLALITDIPWIKTSFLPKSYSNRPYPAWEHNFIFARHPELVNYYVDHVREPYAESTLKRLKYPVGNLQASTDGEFKKRKMVDPNPLGKSPPDYLILKVDTTKRNHPAPMAPELANWAIRAYSREGDLVVDPMCGIGTTCIEAKKLGRNYIGVDINEEYIKEAEKCL